MRPGWRRPRYAEGSVSNDSGRCPGPGCHRLHPTLRTRRREVAVEPSNRVPVLLEWVGCGPESAFGPTHGSATVQLDDWLKSQKYYKTIRRIISLYFIILYIDINGTARYPFGKVPITRSAVAGCGRFEPTDLRDRITLSGPGVDGLHDVERLHRRETRSPTGVGSALDPPNGPTPPPTPLTRGRGPHESVCSGTSWLVSTASRYDGESSRRQK